MLNGAATAVALTGKGGRAAWGTPWVLSALCAALGLGLALGNPNFHWSQQRAVPYGADYLQEWVAGDMLLHGAAKSIYDPVAFAQWQHDPQRIGFTWSESQLYPAVYPPPYYCLVAPLAAVPYRAAALVWLGMMLAAYPLSVWLVERRPWPGQVQGTPSAGRSYLFWWSALLFPALCMSLVMGQKGTLWMLVVVASWQLWRAEKSFAAGCVWALLTVKPTLCYLLPVVMLLNRQWRFSAGVCIGAVVLWGVTATVVPRSLWSEYFSVVLDSSSYQHHAGYRDSWSASLLTLFTACGLPRGLSLGLWAISGGAMLLALLALPRGLAGREKLEQPDFMLRTLIATALLSPHFYFYDLVWLLFPLACMLRLSPRRALAYFAALWLSLLFAQQLETGWPVLPLVLLGIWGHATAVGGRRKV